MDKKIKKQIFLVGMPASGKSYWAKELSAFLGYSYIDLDKAIEEYSGRLIADLFAVSEHYFRQMEAEVLHQLIHKNEMDIVATGGGTPCFYDNMEMMNNKGITIYLEASLDILLARIRKTHTSLPLFNSNNDAILEKKIKQLFLKRRAFYESAQIIINTETITLPIFADLIHRSTISNKV